MLLSKKWVCRRSLKWEGRRGIKRKGKGRGWGTRIAVIIRTNIGSSEIDHTFYLQGCVCVFECMSSGISNYQTKVYEAILDYYKITESYLSGRNVYVSGTELRRQMSSIVNQ